MISEVEFLKISDYVFPNTEMFQFGTSVQMLSPYLASSIKDKAIIYLHFDNIWQFTEYILPNIKSEFKIITGFSDLLVPYLKEPRRDYIADELLNNKYLIKWYAINSIINHPKIKRIPIGIPRTCPGIIQYNNIEQIRYSINPASYNYVTSKINELMTNKNILDVIKSKQHSDKLIYINYSSASTDDTNYRDNFGFRRKLDDYLLEKNFKKENKFKSWDENLSETQNYKYVLEAFGRCFDGFRVWESILIGTIPIVFSSPLNELYDDLPILVIDSFEQINETFLEEQYKILSNRTDYKLEKLRIEYWKNLIYNE